MSSERPASPAQRRAATPVRPAAPHPAPLVPLAPRPVWPLPGAITTTRRLVLAAALVGIALIICLAVPVVATFVIVLWGGDLGGPSTGSMFDGLGVLLGWLGSSLLALALAAVLAIAALVLDVLVAVRAIELGSGRLGGPVRGALPLLFALIAGTGIVSTPVLGGLALFPARLLGPGAATNAMLEVLLALAFVVPLVGRLLMIASSRELTVRAPVPRAGGRSSSLPGARA